MANTMLFRRNCHALSVLIFFILISLLWISNCDARRQFVIREEEDVGSFVVNLAAETDFLQRANRTLTTVELAKLQFKLLKQGNPDSEYFKIEEATGIITTRQRVDREGMCGTQIECLAEIDVGAFSDTFFHIFRVAILIEDVNDNAPTFPATEISIDIPESVSLNTEFLVGGAIDPDIQENGIQSYDIIPQHGIFALTIGQNLDGTVTVGIIVKQSLNREDVDRYRVLIVAKDGGIPRRTGSVIVKIIVTDINDNAPEFTQDRYDVTLSEDTKLQTTIARPRAEDDDTGVNGQVRYKLSARASINIQNTFRVNDTSGEIVLMQSLDYEAYTSYEIVVEAIDLGMAPMTAQCLVVVSVDDVNDNAPQLNFNFLSDGSNARISENVVKGKFIAHMSVSDADSGVNGDVSCETEGKDFKLKPLYNAEYEVILNTDLDRETRSEYRVVVDCRDKGITPLSTSSSFNVEVLDENDNKPYFAIKKYFATVFENTIAGTSVQTVLATDKDIGPNADISYRLEDGFGLMDINSKTGLISTASILDRESIQSIKLIVIGEDNGSTRLSSSTLVVVTILDVNDEKPIFNQTSYQFEVRENQPNITVLGTVFASDQDLGSGGDVYYSVEPIGDSFHLFQISPIKGVIHTTASLDREVKAVHRIRVKATDNGSPFLERTVLVNIIVIDINDNTPVITFPNITHNTVDIDTDFAVDALITSLAAYDVDDGENGRISYSIRNDALYSTYFRINASSGAIIVKRRLNFKKQRVFGITVYASDNGTPRRINASILHVNVSISQKATDLSLPVARGGDEASEGNLHIIIAVVASTVTLAGVILTVICVIKRKELHNILCLKQQSGEWRNDAGKTSSNMVDIVINARAHSPTTVEDIIEPTAAKDMSSSSHDGSVAETSDSGYTGSPLKDIQRPHSFCYSKLHRNGVPEAGCEPDELRCSTKKLHRILSLDRQRCPLSESTTYKNKSCLGVNMMLHCRRADDTISDTSDSGRGGSDEGSTSRDNFIPDEGGQSERQSVSERVSQPTPILKKRVDAKHHCGFPSCNNTANYCQLPASNTYMRMDGSHRCSNSTHKHPDVTITYPDVTRHAVRDVHGESTPKDKFYLETDLNRYSTSLVENKCASRKCLFDINEKAEENLCNMCRSKINNTCSHHNVQLPKQPSIPRVRFQVNPSSPIHRTSKMNNSGDDIDDNSSTSGSYTIEQVVLDELDSETLAGTGV